MKRSARTVSCLPDLVLELGHPSELSVGGNRTEHPGELGVFRHVALHEEGADGRVDSGGEEPDGEIEGAGGEGLRIVLDGDRVEVDDAVDGLELVLVGDPAP